MTWAAGETRPTQTPPPVLPERTAKPLTLRTSSSNLFWMIILGGLLLAAVVLSKPLAVLILTHKKKP